MRGRQLEDSGYPRAVLGRDGIDSEVLVGPSIFETGLRVASLRYPVAPAALDGKAGGFVSSVDSELILSVDPPKPDPGLHILVVLLPDIDRCQENLFPLSSRPVPTDAPKDIAYGPPSAGEWQSSSDPLLEAESSSF